MAARGVFDRTVVDRSGTANDHTMTGADPTTSGDPQGQTIEVRTSVDGVGAAWFDHGRLYRYRLSRVWDAARPRLAWCMLNPSTADAATHDPTIRRVVGFARSWGYGSVDVVNLFALRATTPSLLIPSLDPVGPDNDRAISNVVSSTDDVVLAWGNRGVLANPLTGVPRCVEAADLLADLGVRTAHLGITSAGQPCHPLYVRSEATLSWGTP